MHLRNIDNSDAAGWDQQGGDLLHLLPYIPEMNPIENVWDYLPQNRFYALLWDTHDIIVDACKTAWNWIMADPARITSIGSRD